MANASLSFDHVHLVAQDPKATANWYVEKLGGEIVRSVEVKGAPHYLEGFRPEAIAVVAQWIATRFP